MKTESSVVEIRPFSDGDLSALQERMPSSHHAYRAAAHESGAAIFLLAWMDAKPVGYLLLKWAADEEVVRQSIGDCPELNGITVAPALHSRGIGTSLIHEAERRVSAQGITRVGLAVSLDNHRARSLYERLGYRVWEHGSFEVSWDAPDHPAGRESGIYIYLLKPLAAEPASSSDTRPLS